MTSTSPRRSDERALHCVRIVIPGDPVAKGRPRFRRAGGFVRTYTPAKTATYSDTVSDAARDAMAGQEPFSGPLSAFVHVRLPIPASWPRKRRSAALAGDARPTGKPDVDNFAKLAMDALNGIVWNDDSQVVDLRCVKAYDSEPRVTVEVSLASVLPASGEGL